MGDRPDYYTSSVMLGAYDSEHRAVAVDDDGNIQALLQGHFAGAVRTVALDDNGVMRANLVAQSLEKAIFAINYGTADNKTYADSPPVIGWTTLFTVPGPGIIYGGWLYMLGNADNRMDVIKITIDDDVLEVLRFDVMYAKKMTQPSSAPLYLTLYDTVFNRFGASFAGGITYEDEMKVEYDVLGAAEPEVEAMIYYAER